MRKHDPAPPAFALQKLRREHCVAIPAALALLDAEQHARRVDVIDLEVRDLGHAQARAIGDPSAALYLKAWSRLKQPCGFLHAQNLGSLRRLRGYHQSSREIPTVQCHRDRKRSAETVLLIVTALTQFSCSW